MFEKLSARVSALFAKKPEVLVDLATYQKGYQRTVWYTAGTDLERNIFDQCFEQDVDCLDIDEAGQVSRDALVSIVGTAMNIALDSQIRKDMETADDHERATLRTQLHRGRDIKDSADVFVTVALQQGEHLLAQEQGRVTYLRLVPNPSSAPS